MTSLAYNDCGVHHQISAHDKMRLFQIAIEMEKAQLPEEFIAKAIETGLEYEGVSDLIVMWHEEVDSKERDEIIADIQDLILDCSQATKSEQPYIKLNDLDAISANIREFKDSLFEIVIQQGSISSLADKTGIPQPSLSRFFKSNSMPHRATLLKIAKALKLDAIPVATPWMKG
ncbi:MAG: hypothetical protein CMF50_03365 [Legionellales bacterium]|nr:hypothetical protein [Legionellales bacterium]|tara:strand:+ start:27788 stop:28309 length:522 start_codon:yes stop_codon:yes gene_type:complete